MKKFKILNLSTTAITGCAVRFYMRKRFDDTKSIRSQNHAQYANLFDFGTL